MGMSKYDRQSRDERIIQAHTVGNMTEEEIASALALPRSIIHNALRRHKDRLDTHHAAIANALTRTQLGTLAEQRDVLYTDLPVAMAEFRKLFKNRNAKIRLEAVKSLLDRVGLTPTMAEKLLEQAGVTATKDQPPSEVTINVLLASIQALKEPVHAVTLPPTPPALRALQAESTAKDVKVEILPS